jgi:nickel-type superoxide dismutase maturation protease
MRRSRALLAAALTLEGAGFVCWLGLRIIRSWPARVAVDGHSMEPTLRPGDWLLVDPAAQARRAPRAGDIVVARDPRLPARTIVKRVTAVERDGTIRVAGDHPGHADESELIGAVAPADIIGRPWLRYWPRRRIGPI